VKVVKVTSKGQVTIPAEIRAALGITRDSYLEVAVDGGEVRLRRCVPARPLGADDPVWDLIGVAGGGRSDVSVGHDRYLAESERAGWRESS